MVQNNVVLSSGPFVSQLQLVPYLPLGMDLIVFIMFLFSLSLILWVVEAETVFPPPSRDVMGTSKILLPSRMSADVPNT